ncbi:MAG: hypothetical protein R2734_00160 [Nocardioides sp.]
MLRKVRSNGARRLASVAAASVVVFGLAACGDDGGTSGGDTGGGGGGDTVDIGVILPDATTSPRWEANDKPSLSAAFDAAGVT